MTSGSPALVWVGELARIAAAADIPALSLDLGSPFARLLVSHQSLPAMRVTCIWLGNPWADVWPGPPPAGRLLDLCLRLNPESFALDLPGAAGFVASPTAVIKRIEQTRQHFGREQRLLVAIRGRHLAGGRQHLTQLTALRHLAEEWDFGLALDLARNVDPTWEAEAAVIRLGNRLQHIRVPTSATSRHAVGPARVIARAIAAAMERAVPPEVALVPSVPLLGAGSSRAKADAVTNAAAALASRVVKIKAQRSQFLDQGLWPNLRG